MAGIHFVKVYLWETKTTSEDIVGGSTFWKRTILDPQLSLYIPALRAIGHDPIGAIYDVLRKPDLRPLMIPLVDADGIKIVLDKAAQRVRTKDGKKWRQSGDADAGYVLQTRPETPEEYGARCLSAITERPDRFYARGVVVRLEEESKETAADVWNTATQMRDAKRLNIYPRNPDACIQWSRECDYLNVCAGMASIDDPVLFQTEAEHVELEDEGELADDLSLLTQSAMRAYRSCPRKFQYRYVLRQRPLKKSDALSTGTSVHGALEVFRKSGGDLNAALKALATQDLFVRAKEEAMIVGYVARWGTPIGIVAVEHQFRVALVNPETNAASRTFALGGKVDAIVSADSVGDLMDPTMQTANGNMQPEISLEAP